ncbi:MAG TPA: hypothetical protein VI564_07975 [Candidatus Nanoarchaeia archaeon]|nr:hypothetical protein [Candidatus Nanoarchaeia archaeon]
MKEFHNVVREINRTLMQMMLFENLVNTTIVFLVSYLLLTILDFNALYAIIPSLLYLFYYTFLSFKTSKALMIEGKYAPLREKLRTAADNLGTQNVIVEELEYEVISEMKNVGLSMFINPKSLSYKIFAVMILSFMIIFTTTLNVRLLDLAKKNVAPYIFEGPKGVGNLVSVTLNTSEDIYGNKDVANLGDNELNIKIRPMDFKVNVKEEGDSEERDFDTVFPKEVAVKESSTFEENIAPEEQELVKNYFKRLAEG